MAPSTDNAFAMISSSPLSGFNRGSWCRFLRINSEWGIKLYNDEKMRDKTYKLQEIAYMNGFAPMLGDKFEIPRPRNVDFSGHKLYGYYTECIEETYFDRCRRLNPTMDKFGPDIELDQDDDFQNLLCDWDQFMFMEDIHSGNIGYMADGKFVVIDFSHCEEYMQEEKSKRGLQWS